MTDVKFVNNFLNEISTENVKSAFDSLNSLIKELEEKNDPEPVEMEIVNLSYQLQENLNLLQSALRKYKNEQNVLTGNILESLYNND